MLSRSHMIWIIGVVSLLVLGGSIWGYYEDFQQPIDLLAITGAIASIFGLLVVFIQVSAIRSTTQAAHLAARSTHDKVMAFLSAMDIARTIKIVQEIQAANRAGKYEIAILRIQDLKYVLRDILNNPRFSGIIDPQCYQKHINKISLQIGSLEKELEHSSSEKFNIAKMNSVFELVLDDLIHLDTLVKQKG